MRQFYLDFLSIQYFWLLAILFSLLFVYVLFFKNLSFVFARMEELKSLSFGRLFLFVLIGWLGGSLGFRNIPLVGYLLTGITIAIFFIPISKFEVFERWLIFLPLFQSLLRLGLQGETVVFGLRYGAFYMGGLLGFTAVLATSFPLLLQLPYLLSYFAFLIYLRFRSTVLLLDSVSSGEGDIRVVNGVDINAFLSKRAGLAPGSMTFLVGSVFCMGRFAFPSGARTFSSRVWSFLTVENLKQIGITLTGGALGGFVAYTGMQAESRNSLYNADLRERVIHEHANFHKLDPNLLMPSEKALVEQRIGQLRALHDKVEVWDIPVVGIFTGRVTDKGLLFSSLSDREALNRVVAQRALELSREQAVLASQRALELSFKQGQIKHYQEINSWNASWGGTLLGKKELPPLPSGLAEHKVSMAPVLRSIESIPKVPCTWEWNIWSFLF